MKKCSKCGRKVKEVFYKGLCIECFDDYCQITHKPYHINQLVIQNHNRHLIQNKLSNQRVNENDKYFIGSKQKDA